MEGEREGVVCGEIFIEMTHVLLNYGVIMCSRGYARNVYIVTEQNLMY